MNYIVTQSAESKYSDRGSTFFGIIYPIESVLDF